jgi:hypothetical protein
MARHQLAAAVLFLLLPAAASATVIHVDWSGGGDYLTIQEGINAANEGDTVLVAPGTYAGPLNRDLDFGGENLVLRGTAGAESTVIDCEDLGRGFHFHGGESTSSVVERLTITHGYGIAGPSGYVVGGGILCESSSSPTISHVAFLENDAYGGGAVCCWYGCSPSITECTFEDNTANEGGGIFCYQGSSPSVTACLFSGNSGAAMAERYSSPVVRECTFSNNAGVAIRWGEEGSPRLENCIVSENSGGGLTSGFCNPTVVFCTFSGNTGFGAFFQYSHPSLSNVTFSGNLGDAVQCGEEAWPTLTDCIIAFSSGAGVHCLEGAVVHPTVSRCCVFGNAAGDSLCGTYHDNMFEDPLFCDADSSDFTLYADSPCLPANNEWGELLGAHGAGACGWTPVERTFYAEALGPEAVRLRWTVGSLAGIEGFTVARAVSQEGPFVPVTEEPVSPNSPGVFEDTTVWPETTFWYELRALFADGHEEAVSPSAAQVTTGGRLAVVLYPAAPNPFRGATSIQFDVPVDAADVRLAVYSARGQLVRTLVDGLVSRGRHAAAWDGRDESGAATSSGVYFVRLEIGREVRGQKLVVSR